MLYRHDLGFLLGLGALVLCAGCLQDSGPRSPVAAGMPEEGTLILTVPDGGEVWTAGALAFLAWEARGNPGPCVMLELLRGGEPCRLIAAATENDGTFAWVCDPCGEDSTGYQVRVSDPQNGLSDCSAASFQITPATDWCALEILTPEASPARIAENLWIENEPLEITWESDGGGCGAAVAITLLQDSLPCLVIADGIPNCGAYIWPVTCPGADTTGLGLRVVDLSSGAWDETPQVFRIRRQPPEPSLTVLVPNGGEEWIEGQTYAITWQHSGPCGQQVAIELLQNDELYAVIAAQTANDGHCAWTASLGDNQPDALKVRIRDLTSGASDESDAPFRILRTDAITLLAPNGGEVWVRGSPHAITWHVPPDAGELVRLELLQVEEVCSLISGAAANSGSFTWTAAQCAGQTAGYRVRVTDLGSALSDVSDADFSIENPCSLTVTAPNGGERWLAGEIHTLSWDPRGACGDHVSLAIRTDGGPAQVITGLTLNDGIYSWTAQPYVPGGGQHWICVTDLESGAADCSDASFFIGEPCELAIYTPGGGEEYLEGEDCLIAWDTRGSCDGTMRIELLRAGAVCETIMPSAPNTGLITWRARRCGTHESGYQVRITHLESGAAVVSPGSFRIIGQCDLRVISPNGGEYLTEGERHTINWDVQGACGDDVVVELLYGGVVCETLAEAASDGFLEWVAVQCRGHTAGYKIRVRDPASGARDDSNAGFAIRDPCELDVLAPNGGEQLMAGLLVTISWDAGEPCSDLVDVVLLSGGAHCATIAVGTPNSGNLSWPATAAGAVPDRYRIVVMDPERAVADTSDGDFRIDQPVYLEVSFSAGAAAFASNHSDWLGSLVLEFEGGGSHAIADPAWLECPGPALVLGSGATCYPSDGGRGLSLPAGCTAVGLELMGAGECAGPQMNLSLTTDAPGACRRELPVTRACGLARTGFAADCLSAAGPLRILIAYSAGSDGGCHYAISSIRYVFYGWVVSR